MGEEFKRHKEEFGIVWIAGIVATLASIGGTSIAGWQLYDGIATDVEVEAVMITHETNMRGRVAEWNSQQDARVSGLESKLDLLLANQARAELGGQIDKLYKHVCTTGDHQFDDTIKTLKREYRIAVGEEYIVKTCDEYKL